MGMWSLAGKQKVFTALSGPSIAGGRMKPAAIWIDQNRLLQR